MSMFGGQGDWWLGSKSDPRWNANGRGRIFVCSGDIHPDATSFIEAKKRELGIEPPADLEYGCMKD